MTEEFKTEEKRNYKGKLSLRTEYDLGMPTDKGPRILRLSTSKDGDRASISSLASVHIREDKDGYGVESYMLFQDYAKTLNRIPIARVTEKALRDAHAESLKAFPSIIEEAKAHYSPKA
jgi:hypothetical protein